MRKYLFKAFKKEYLLNIKFGFLLLCFFVQRILRINSEFKYLINYTSKLIGAENLILDNCPKIKTSFLISGGCYFSCSTKTTIKKGTIFAPGVKIISGNHDFYDYDKIIVKEVFIGENCWIGADAVILPGVVLGNNVVVGANSVVTRSFESNCVIAGSPAKKIKEL